MGMKREKERKEDHVEGKKPQTKTHKMTTKKSRLCRGLQLQNISLFSQYHMGIQPLFLLRFSQAAVEEPGLS